MTQIKPDYSKIPPMILKCASPYFRSEIISELNSLCVDVKCSAWSDVFPNITWDCVNIKSTDISIGAISHEEFIAPFEKIWEEWKHDQGQLAYPINMPFVADKQLIVPSDEEIYNHCQIYFGCENNTYMACRWMRDQIIKLNKINI